MLPPPQELGQSHDIPFNPRCKKGPSGGGVGGGVSGDAFGKGESGSAVTTLIFILVKPCALSAVKVGAPSFLKTNDWKPEMGNTGDLGIRTHLTVEPDTPGGKVAAQGLSLRGDADETPVTVR